MGKLTPIRKTEDWQLMPSSAGTEAAILGTLVVEFFDREIPAQVHAQLRPEMFHNQPHKDIMEAAMEVGASPLLISEHLKKEGRSVAVAVVLSYTEHALPLLLLPKLVASLNSYQEARSAMSATRSAAAYAKQGNPEEARAVLSEYVATPSKGGQGLEQWGPAVASVENAVERIAKLERGESDGWPTGIEYFDEVVNSSLGGGLQPGQLGIVAGRPGKGKTTWLVNMLCEAMRSNLGGQEKEGLLTAFFSFEMTADQVAQKVLARHTQRADLLCGVARRLQEARGVQPVGPALGQ